MKVALDTSVYVNFCKGDQKAVEVVQSAHEVYLPFAVLGELRAGFACGSMKSKNAQVLTRFLNKPRVKVLYPNEATTHSYANLFRQLRQQGTPIPTNDLWIGALCVQHGLLLASSDKHFMNLPQIPRV